MAGASFGVRLSLSVYQPRYKIKGGGNTDYDKPCPCLEFNQRTDRDEQKQPCTETPQFKFMGKDKDDVEQDSEDREDDCVIDRQGAKR